MRKFLLVFLAVAALVVSACDVPFTPGGPALGHSPELVTTCAFGEGTVPGPFGSTLNLDESIAIDVVVANSWSSVWNDTEYVMHIYRWGWDLADFPAITETLYDENEFPDPPLLLNPGVDPAIDPESTGDSIGTSVFFPEGWDAHTISPWIDVAWIPVGGGTEIQRKVHQLHPGINLPDCTPEGQVITTLLNAVKAS